jgi:hypothetical protein
MERVAETYERVLSGLAQFRVVLAMSSKDQVGGAPAVYALSGSGHGVLVRRGTVYGWNRHVIQAQVDGELSAMMNDVAHREAA